MGDKKEVESRLNRTELSVWFRWSNRDRLQKDGDQRTEPWHCVGERRQERAWDVWRRTLGKIYLCPACLCVCVLWGMHWKTFHHLPKIITRTQNIPHCLLVLLVPGHFFWALWEELGLVAKRGQWGCGVSLFRSGAADLELCSYVPDWDGAWVRRKLEEKCCHGAVMFPTFCAQTFNQSSLKEDHLVWIRCFFGNVFLKDPN